eukprot:2647277-Pleurochrysis_carterae.AAC.1
MSRVRAARAACVLRVMRACSCSPLSAMAFASALLTALCFARGAVSCGNRSSMSERKSGTSSATYLDRFMSRSVRISRRLSLSSGASRFDLPAVRSTARMLRSPKSGARGKGAKGVEEQELGRGWGVEGS